MPADHKANLPTRRRFLRRSTLVAGAVVVTGSRFAVSNQVKAGEQPPPAMDAWLEEFNHQPLFAPLELLLSIIHQPPDPSACLSQLLNALNHALASVYLTVEPWSTTTAEWSWTFSTPSGYDNADTYPNYSVLRYRICACGQVQDILIQPPALSVDLSQIALLAISRLLAQLAELNGSLQNCLEIKSVTPNWIVTAAQGRILFGGPGGQPSALPTTPGSGQVCHFTFPTVGATHPAVVPAPQGRVRAVVMDTAPTPQVAIQVAKQRYRANKPLHDLLPVLAGIRDVVGKSPAEQALHPTPIPCPGQTPEPPYMMPDHGLFVAGIIHDVAPTCQLEMIRVLNDYGASYLTSLLAGLHTVFQQIKSYKGHIVVNMSLTVKVPVSAQLSTLFASLPVLYQPPPPPNFPYPTPWAASQPLFDIIQSMPSVYFVAAAGNDSAPLPSPLEPRVPAVYPNTHGVAAVDANGKRAPYSNMGDDADPVKNGVATFGGGACSSAPTRVVGLYTAPDYPGQPTQSNLFGWAEWVGTSFATPVIAGLAANWWGNEPSLNPTALIRQISSLPSSTSLASSTSDQSLNCPTLRANQSWR